MLYYKTNKVNFVAKRFITLLLFIPLLCTAETLTFSAPPRETAEKGELIYAPIAKYISEILGRKVVYKHPGNWVSYSSNIRKNKYDIIFDGPHFVSWRIAKRKHTPLIKIPGDFFFYFITNKNNQEINTLKDIIGKKVCGHAPPNQGTLRLFDKFENPSRQPVLKEIKGWRNIYSATIKGVCDVGVVPFKIFNVMEKNRKQAKIIFETKHVSGQAITSGPSLDLSETRRIRAALLTEEGNIATEGLRKRFASPRLVKATKNEYDKVYTLLRHSYWFRD